VWESIWKCQNKDQKFFRFLGLTIDSIRISLFIFVDTVQKDVQKFGLIIIFQTAPFNDVPGLSAFMNMFFYYKKK